MNLFLITPYFPYPADSGGNTRTLNLLKGLTQHGENITLCVISSEQTPPAVTAAFHHELPCVETVFLPILNRRLDKLLYFVLNRIGLDRAFCYLELKRTICRMLSERKIDVIQTDYSQTARYLPRTSIPSILAFIEFRGRVLEREVDIQKAAKGGFIRRLHQTWLWREELSHCSRYNRFICVSETDRNWLLKNKPSLQVDVIENGVDPNSYPFHPAHALSGIYFLGWFMNRQNIFALDYFLDDIWPRLPQPRPDFMVIGKDLDAVRRQRLTVEGIRYAGFLDHQALQKAVQGRILITPLRSGSGTRLKILEAMAMGNPVISTTIGAEGIEARHREHLLVADSPEDFTACLTELLRDRYLRENMAQHARALVESKYRWDSLADQLARIHRQMAGSRQSPAAR